MERPDEILELLHEIRDISREHLDEYKTAAERSIESLKFAGDAIITDSDAFCRALQRKPG